MEERREQERTGEEREKIREKWGGLMDGGTGEKRLLREIEEWEERGEGRGGIGMLDKMEGLDKELLYD